MYKIIVFDGLSTGRFMFSGNSLWVKKLLLYDRHTGHYRVIINCKIVMAKQYIYNGCASPYDFKQKVTNFVPCVLLRHPVLKVKLSLVVHATGDFSVRNVSRIV